MIHEKAPPLKAHVLPALMVHSEPDGDEGEDGEPSGDMLDAADMLIRAVHRKDPAAVVDALKACMEAYHEGPDEEPEPDGDEAA